MTKYQKMINPVLSILCILCLIQTLTKTLHAEQCTSKGSVYGENVIIDQLMACTLSKTFDLDLAPRGDYLKATPKTLVEQGLANHTTILYAKMSGLWSVSRARIAETSWRCDGNTTTAHAILEVRGLALDVIEKVDIPIQRSQYKLASHRPCKTHDIPVWLCRQAKPIYKTTKTWVNMAYFNLTLTQQSDSDKPEIKSLDLLFTCPETFNQKITHSPSAMYVLTKYMQNIEANLPSTSSSSSSSSSSSESTAHKKIQKRNITEYGSPRSLAGVSVAHPVAYTSTQNGKSPTTPPYHSSVNLIVNQATEVLQSSINECIQAMESDLSLVIDHNSFTSNRFNQIRKSGEEVAGHQVKHSKNECSDKSWIVNRLNLAAESAGWMENDNQQQQYEATTNHSKRNRLMSSSYPQDPNQLLDPYKHYDDARADQMIDRR